MLVSWGNVEKQLSEQKKWEVSSDMGGYEIISRQGLGVSDFVMLNPKFKRVIRSMTYELLACLEARKQELQMRSNQVVPPNETRLQLLRRIGDTWKGPGRDYFEDADQTIPYADAIEDFDFTRRTEPCGLWFGKWEEEAIQFRKTLSQASDSKSSLASPPENAVSKMNREVRDEK